MDRIQDAATELVRDYLDQPYQEMVRSGCNDLEIACAFISLGYHVLRYQRSKTRAAETFNALAHFGMQRIETGRNRFLKLH